MALLMVQASNLLFSTTWSTAAAHLFLTILCSSNAVAGADGDRSQKPGACATPENPSLLLFPQAMGTELQSKRFLLSEAEQNLLRAKTCSNTLASKFQEHCPDIERQEAELYKLNQRFNNLSKQIDHR